MTILRPLMTTLLALCLAWLAHTPAWANKPAAKREPPDHQATPKPDAPLSPELLAIAARVVTGRIPCELGQSVAVQADATATGTFMISSGALRFRVQPVATSTGAIRLEDKSRGAVWLQLANKSMLLDAKSGRRLTDACTTPTQRAVADALKTQPQLSILGIVPGAVPNEEPLPQPPLSAQTAPAVSPTALNDAANPAAPSAALKLNLPPSTP